MKLVLGLIRETKSPPDRRVALTPSQCRELNTKYPWLKIVVQPSPIRCFADEEYRTGGIELLEDLGECDVLFGVKEVETGSLIEGKTYFFFSHTAKAQPYNRPLLKSVLDKGIRLVDYEYLADPGTGRVVAFGRWAGIVGAYNALMGWGRLQKSFFLRPASDCRDLADLKKGLREIAPGQVKIVLTGGGRVAAGAMEVLDAAGIPRVPPDQYIQEDCKGPVFTRLDPWHYTRRKDGNRFDFNHFTKSPGDYANAFLPYASVSDLYVACHFWDPGAPVLLGRSDLATRKISLRLIADISCDINGPIASTLRASTQSDPFYGYDPASGKETGAFTEGSVTVMAVDNLPGELPRDASRDFGTALSEHVIPELEPGKEARLLTGATIAAQGRLTAPFAYLQDFVDQL